MSDCSSFDALFLDCSHTTLRVRVTDSFVSVVDVEQAFENAPSETAGDFASVTDYSDETDDEYCVDQ